MTFKILHISDIHWRGLERHDEYQCVFDKLYEWIESQNIKPDLIVNTGDTWHTKLQNITPEGFRNIKNMFMKLAEYAPVYSIYGNHDLNLQNKDRHNIIAEIIESVAQDKTVKNQVLLLDGTEIARYKNLVFFPFSCTTPDYWDKIKEQKKELSNDDIPIALFHGAVAGCVLDNETNLHEGELAYDNFIFQEFPFVLMGDIHKRQNLAYRSNVKTKLNFPYAAYAGSLIQQDFGESINGHGFLLWEIDSVESWNIIEFDIHNPYQKVTFTWMGVEATFNEIKSKVEKDNLDNRISIRIQHGGVILSTDIKELKQKLKSSLGLTKVVFSHSKSIEREQNFVPEQTNNFVVRTNHDLLVNYLDNNPQLKNTLIPEDFKVLSKLLEESEKEVSANNIEVKRTVWKLKELWFENIFAYGEQNYINFDNYEGNVGLFGPNRVGKSTILAAVCYALFNSTDRGPINGYYIINENKQYCRAKARIEIAGESYWIERFTKRSSSKTEVTNTKVKFYKENAKGIENLNGNNRTETDKKIREVIGTYEDFQNTLLASQNDLLSFIQKGSTECKLLLSKYFNIDNYLNIGTYAAKTRDKIQQSISEQTIDSYELEINSIEDAIHEIQTSIIDNEAKIQMKKNHLDSLIEQIKSLNTEKYDDYKKCKANLESFYLDIEKTEKAHQDLIEQKTKIINEITELNSVISELKEENDKYTKTKNSIQELNNVLGKNEKEKVEQKKKLKLLDDIPCGVQFPSCSFIADSFTAKEKLPFLEEAANNLVTQIASLEAILGQFASNLKSSYQEANNRLIEASTTLKMTEKRMVEVEAHKRDVETRIAINLKKISDYEAEGITASTESPMDGLLEVNQINIDINFLEKQNYDSKARIKELVSSKEDKKKSINQLIENMKLHRCYNAIAETFSKNGVPAQILREYVESINFFAGLVTKDTDFDVKVRIDPETNSLDINYVFGMKARPIETCSGAEKTFAALALRVALVQCSSMPLGNILFLDECFGALDEELLVVARQLLSSLEMYFDIILLISHESYLREMSTTQIHIRKNEEGFSEVISQSYKNVNWEHGS